MLRSLYVTESIAQFLTGDKTVENIFFFSVLCYHGKNISERSCGMPKSEHQKQKLLYIEQFLRMYTDETHSVTTPEIIRYLE